MRLVFLSELRPSNNYVPQSKRLQQPTHVDALVCRVLVPCGSYAENDPRLQVLYSSLSGSLVSASALTYVLKLIIEVGLYWKKYSVAGFCSEAPIYVQE
jgi:hypothetical protein